MFKSYELYASVLFEAIDLLASPTFAELVGAMSEELAPLTIEQHLQVRRRSTGTTSCAIAVIRDTQRLFGSPRQAPMDAARRMAAWLQGVLEMTPEDHPDHRCVHRQSRGLARQLLRCLGNRGIGSDLADS